MGLQEILAVNIKKWRKHAGLTQEQLAKLCDTDSGYIGQIETGRRCPSLLYIERIAAALSIAPYQLFYDELEATALTANIERKQQIKAALIERVSQGIQSVIDELC